MHSNFDEGDKMDITTVEIPKDLAHLLRIREKDLSKKIKEILAVELYREGTVSLGKAAEISGLTKWEMLELLAMKKIPLQYYPEDLDEDIETLRKLRK